jgi:uncharacterized protein (TIGR00369 family)
MSLSWLIEAFETGIPFNRFLGVRVEGLTEGEAFLRIPFKDELIGDFRRPALHGGVTSALVDAAGGLAVWSTLADGATVSTIDLRVDYLRPGLEADLFCKAEVMRIGNRVGVSTMSVHQGDPSAPIAEARGVYNIKRPGD